MRRRSRIPVVFAGLVCAAGLSGAAGAQDGSALGSPAPTPAPTVTPSAADAPLPMQPPSLAAALKALHTGRSESAAHDLQQLREAGTFTAPGEGLFLVGRAWLAAGRPEFAVLPLRQASRDYDPLADYALFHLAEAYLEMDRPADAARTWERLLVDYPDTVLAARTRVRLADALVAAEEYDRARDLYQQALDGRRSGTPSDELLARIADAYQQEGRLDDAAATWFHVWRDYPAGDAADRAGDALDELAKAGAQVPSRTSTDARYRRALALADSGHAADAAKLIDALVAAHARLPGDWRLKRAKLLFRSRQYSDSRREYQKLARLYPPGPRRAESMYWYARSLARQNDYDGATKVYEKLRASFPRLAWSRDGLYKEGLMALEDKKFSSAARRFALYARIYPTASDADEALWYAGWSHFRAKQYVTAIETFHRLTSRYPHSSLVERAQYWTGRAQILSGRRDDGITTLSSVALESSLTYYGLLASGALAEAGVDVPVSPSAGVDEADLDPSEEDGDAESEDAADEEDPDPAAAPADDLPPDAADDADVPAPPASYRFHYSRAKTLVRLGYLDDAASELAAARSAAETRGQKLDLARLAMAADYYHGAQTIARLSFADELAKSHGEGEIVRLAYPKAWPEYVTSYAGQYKYSPSVLWAIMREESTYRPEVVSPVGAIGLLQIMPYTGEKIAHALGVKGFTAERLFEPEVNIGFSAWYVRNLLEKYGGNEALAIASYNAGPDAVDRWLKARGDLPLDAFVEEIPYTETRRYVKRVLMSYGIYEALYGSGAPRIRGVKPVAKAPVVGAMTVASGNPPAPPDIAPASASPESDGTAGTQSSGGGATP